MHYYTFHPKDYISKTHFLDPLEDIAYRRMLDYIYLNECHLPSDVAEIAKRINMRTHTDSIASVLDEFFDLTDKGYMNDRAEQEIAKYQEKSEKARKSANARWKNKEKDANADKEPCEGNANALPTQSEGNANQEPLTTNHELITNNQENGLDVFEKTYNDMKNILVKSGIIPIDKRVNDEQLKPDIYTFVAWCDGKKMEEYKRTNAVVGYFKKKGIDYCKRFYTFEGDVKRNYYNPDDYKKSIPVSDEAAAAIKAKYMGALGM